MNKFEEFKKKEKFLPDSAIFYPGIADPKLKPILTDKINEAADDFQMTSRKVNPTDVDFRAQIETGLDRFKDIYLDTEDRERVCHYFEELMNIVGLKSSSGILNRFMYGFDPDSLNKKITE